MLLTVRLLLPLRVPVFPLLEPLLKTNHLRRCRHYAHAIFTRHSVLARTLGIPPPCESAGNKKWVYGRDWIKGEPYSLGTLKPMAFAFISAIAGTVLPPKRLQTEIA